jgi:hypothetical protein
LLSTRFAEGAPLVSVHVPKTAGTSLRMAFQSAFGQEQILLDYSDDPADPCSTTRLDPHFYERRHVRALGPYRVVHGHFSPIKYAQLAPAVRIAFLREPVQNVISIYHFWRRYDVPGNALLDYMRTRRLTLEEFARLPIMRYLYTSTYFGNVDMTSFDFVGDAAQYNEEVVRLSALLGVPLATIRTNTGPERAYAGEQGRDLEDVSLRERLAVILADDVGFYQKYRGR